MSGTLAAVISGSTGALAIAFPPLLVVPYVLLPVFLGRAWSGGPASRRLLFIAALITSGPATLALAVGFLGIRDGGLVSALLTPFVFGIPAILVAMPVFRLSHGVTEAEAPSSSLSGRVVIATWLIGGCWLVVSSMLAWVVVQYELTHLNTNGLSGNGLGYIPLIGGIAVVLVAGLFGASRPIHLMIPLVTSIASAATAVAVAFAPSLHLRSSAEPHPVALGPGIAHTLVGAVLLAVGAVLAWRRAS